MYRCPAGWLWSGRELLRHVVCLAVSRGVVVAVSSYIVSELAALSAPFAAQTRSKLRLSDTWTLHQRHSFRISPPSAGRLETGLQVRREATEHGLLAWELGL